MPEEKEAFSHQCQFIANKVLPIYRHYIAQKQHKAIKIPALKANPTQVHKFSKKIVRGVKLVMFKDKIWIPDELMEELL
eukprot:609979-Ditylum_brightwellii.AAC.1